jgi:hypothetical protein
LGHLGHDKSLLHLFKARHHQTDVPADDLRFSVCHTYSHQTELLAGRHHGLPRREVDLLVADVAPHGGGADVEEGVAREAQPFKVENARLGLKINAPQLARAIHGATTAHLAYLFGNT